MKAFLSGFRSLRRVLPALLVLGAVARGESAESSYLGREIPSSPDWKLEAKGGSDSVDADSLVLQTPEPKENRAYRWVGDLGSGKGFQADLELFVREGIARVVLMAVGPDGPVQYSVNLYSIGTIGAYGPEGYRTAKVPGGRFDSIQLRLRGEWGSEMVVSTNEDPRELLVFAPLRHKGTPKPGLSLGDDSNSYKTEMVVRRVVIRR